MLPSSTTMSWILIILTDPSSCWRIPSIHRHYKNIASANQSRGRGSCKWQAGYKFAQPFFVSQNHDLRDKGLFYTKPIYDKHAHISPGYTRPSLSLVIFVIVKHSRNYSGVLPVYSYSIPSHEATEEAMRQPLTSHGSRSDHPTNTHTQTQNGVHSIKGLPLLSKQAVTQLRWNSGVSLVIAPMPLYCYVKTKTIYTHKTR